MDPPALARRVEDTYHAPVAAVLLLTEQMLELASAGVFCLHHPSHPFTQEIRKVAGRIA
jgi:septum site-determining protein MinD